MFANAPTTMPGFILMFEFVMFVRFNPILGPNPISICPKEKAVAISIMTDARISFLIFRIFILPVPVMKEI